MLSNHFDLAPYRGKDETTRVETFRLVCPQCGTINMLDVTFEEHRDA